MGKKKVLNKEERTRFKNKLDFDLLKRGGGLMSGDKGFNEIVADHLKVSDIKDRQEDFVAPLTIDKDEILRQAVELKLITFTEYYRKYDGKYVNTTGFGNSAFIDYLNIVCSAESLKVKKKLDRKLVFVTLNEEMLRDAKKLENAFKNLVEIIHPDDVREKMIRDRG